MPKQPNVLNTFAALEEIVSALRGPEGCPWDKEQTGRSLAPYAIEEVYELVSAIEDGNPEDIKEELGDVLFQVGLHAQVAKEKGQFDLSEVLETLNEKMIRRHPHVFSGVEVNGVEDVWKNWEKIKKAEKENKKIFQSRSNDKIASASSVSSVNSVASASSVSSVNSISSVSSTASVSSTTLSTSPGEALESPFSSIPKSLPALQASYKIGVKTDKLKFDWEKVTDVMAKVEEELSEVQEVMNRPSFSREFKIKDSPINQDLRHEIGDLLFAVSQLARHVDVEPEQALREANQRFEKRFVEVLRLNSLSGREWDLLSLDDKEALWKQAKKNLK